MPVAQEATAFRLQNMLVAGSAKLAAIETRLAAIEATLAIAAEQDSRVESKLDNVIVRLDTIDRRDFARGE